MDSIDIPALWRQFLASEIARAGAIVFFASWATNKIKPYLPTGANRPGVAGAVENRYAPFVIVALFIVLNLGGAFLANSQGVIPVQDPWLSGVLGLGTGLAWMGFWRAIRLAIAGDPVERERAQVVSALREVAPIAAVEAREPGVQRPKGE